MDAMNRGWSVLFLALAIGLFSLMDTASLPIPMEQSQVYHAVTVAAPVLTGLPLRLLAEVIEMPVLGPLLYRYLAHKNNMHEIRRLARSLPQDKYHVLAYPVYTLSATEQQQHEEAAASFGQSTLQSIGQAALSSGFHFRSIHEYNTAYRSGTATPTDTAEHFLEAYVASEESDVPLRAFAAVHADDVLDQARASTERWAQGAPLSVLDGVPVAVKDSLEVIGYATRKGTAFLGSSIATTDATAVARLRAAGALIVGKTSMHEIGIGNTGINPIRNESARNPYDTSRLPGGSSSGSAAAVAAGLVPLAVGVDGGGSIRTPAALCGIVGLKPTFGRVPLPLHESGSNGHVGPMAGSVADAAIGYAIMAGAEDGSQPPVHLAALSQSLQGIRIGYMPDWNADAHPHVVEAVDAALQRAVDQGASLHSVSIPFLGILRKAQSIGLIAGMAFKMERHYLDRRSMNPDTRINLALGRYVTSQDMLATELLRCFIMDHLNSLWTDVDVLVTPTTPTVAPIAPVGAYTAGISDLGTTSSLMRFVSLANYAGLPAVAVPAGYDPAGMPMSVQVMGKHWAEDRVLQVAAGMAAPLQKPQVYWE